MIGALDDVVEGGRIHRAVIYVVSKRQFGPESSSRAHTLVGMPVDRGWLCQIVLLSN